MSVALWAGAGLAEAQQSDNPVVVELFTSQGCSSCPPADKLLASLAARDDVIALALHVDYWDYIGWKDSFAQPGFTTRQRGYAYAAGSRAIYTPQMIVNGADHVMGANAMAVMDSVRAHQDRRSPITLRLSRTGDTLTLEARAPEPVDALDIHLVRYRPSASVRITKGENAGRTLDYANIVTDWQLVGRWEGDAPLRMELDLSGEAPAVVLLQKLGHGPIRAAARLR
ncbi:MAG: DUF1223 domain-containing protein [Paracoccaceae bacterium]